MKAMCIVCSNVLNKVVYLKNTFFCMCINDIWKNKLKTVIAFWERILWLVGDWGSKEPFFLLCNLSYLLYVVPFGYITY